MPEAALSGGLDDRAGSDPLVFAEKLLGLLDAGRYTATYKFAVLIALIDECVESVDDQGHPPARVSGLRIGTRVLGLFWPQAIAYRAGAGDDMEPVHLRHSTQPNDLVRVISDYRIERGVGPGVPLEAARRSDPAGLAHLERRVVTTVIRMPIPRLQRLSTGVGFSEDRFLYDFGWSEDVSESRVRAGDFDDTLHLRPGVGAWLVRLAGVLRPIIQQRWAAFVADRSRTTVEAAWLDEFLFGATRVGLDRIRLPLLEAQDHSCFYCRQPVPLGGAQVDHFIPWIRHPDNGLDNLVAAHTRCNNNKRDTLASAEHLEAWVDRVSAPNAALAQLRSSGLWPSEPARSLGAARATYLWVPEGTPLWSAVGLYRRADPRRLRSILIA